MLKADYRTQKKTNGKLNKSILYDKLINAKKLFTRLWALPNYRQLAESL